MGMGISFSYFTQSKPKPLGVGVSLSYFGQGLFFFEDPYSCETYLSDNKANNFSNLDLVFQLAPTGGT